MKKIVIILSVLMGVTFSSCTDYLDVSPDSGLTEAEIFSNYNNTVKFFQNVYNGDLKSGGSAAEKIYNMDVIQTFGTEFSASPKQFSMNQTTDLYTANKAGAAWSFIKGSWGTNGGYFNAFYNDDSTNNFRPVFKGMLSVIRICNVTLQNLDRITDANDQKDIEDLRGQAHFIRAYAHYYLGRLWGPFPYITEPLSPTNWDLPRLPRDEYFKAIADDLNKAVEIFRNAGLMRRDPIAGEAGHLADANQNRPCGISALALRSSVLLYRASDLNNEGHSEYWAEAAEAAAEAIKEAETLGYELLSWDKYYNNFYNSTYTNEHLWAWAQGAPMTGRAISTNAMGVFLGTTLSTCKVGAGEFPTQNIVDMYDTAWGEPLVTESDRAAAAAAGHYNEADPYANRDPRLEGNIFYNQHDMIWTKSIPASEKKSVFNCYYTENDGKRTFSTHAQGLGGKIGDSPTGYIGRKRTGDFTFGNSKNIKMPECVLRLAEVYLNYAEAAGEAYGGAQGQAPNSSLTALDALNAIRGRVSQDLVLASDNPTVADQPAFRERVRKEWAIEFDQENNRRYFDIRRWKIAPEVMSQPKYGMMIEKVAGSSNDAPYEEQFIHTRVELGANYQAIWSDYMYYWPFKNEDYFKYKVFDTGLNPYW